MHTPVLLQEAVDQLNVFKGGRYIDATFGSGGHSNEIVKRGGKVLALDWNEETVNRHNFKKKDAQLKIVWGNYANIEEIAKRNNFLPVEGCLFDLGLSMEEILFSGRGFSFRRDRETLDMRISKKSLKVTAADIINSSTEKELYEIFSRYSEELGSESISQAIVRARRMKKIVTVDDLIEAITKVGVKASEKTLRRVFQALRVAVNHEFENITKGIKGGLKVLKKGGKLVVITFHPSEDRLVKSIFRQNNLKSINKKNILSRQGYQFERSAKLRIVQI